MTRRIMTTATASVALITALTTAAFAGQLPDQFSAIDANADGQVTYNEFSKVATKQGMTRTAAAQKFIKISNGNTSFTEGDLMTAIAMQDQPDWGQSSVAANTTAQGTLEAGPTATPNTAVLSGTTGADIPRWSDGTPVDLEAADTSYEQSSEIMTGEETRTPTPVPATVATGDTVIGDVSATGNPQTKVWNETDGTVTAETPGAEINVETDTTMDTKIVEDGMNDMKSDMKTTVETPEMKIEVEPQPEK